MSILGELQLLEPGNKFVGFELDASELGGGSLFFHAHRQSTPIFWQGEEYSPWPVEATGFTRTSEQQQNPTINVANIDGTIGSMCLLYDDLVGAKLIMRRTLVKYLDAVNFPGGNPTADPGEAFPDEIWYIERKVSEDKTVVQFELTSAANFNDQQLPGRQIIGGVCGWIARGGYRGPYCGYTGTAYFDINDEPVADPSLDVCGGRLHSCKLRFGENNELPYGGYPAAGLI